MQRDGSLPQSIKQAQTADDLVRDIADLAARLSLWPARTLSSHANDLGRLRDLLQIIERAVLDASTTTTSDISS